MPLETDDKIIASATQEMLVELNEPEAWLETLRRIAARKLDTLKVGSMGDEQHATRWRKLVKAIEAVQAELDRPEPKPAGPDFRPEASDHVDTTSEPQEA